MKNIHINCDVQWSMKEKTIQILVGKNRDTEDVRMVDAIFQ